MAGKTGTTNDNSDAWFIGYTPQLLAGGWVGCDDRFIRFNTESKNGEGGRAAMPIWAYFMGKAAADPNCGLDPKLSFVKPEAMPEIIIQETSGVPIGDGETNGTLKSDDYSVPKDIKKEDIIPLDSEKPEDQKDTKQNKPGDTKEKDAKKPQTAPPGILPKKEPKGVMPPVKKPGNGR